MLQLFSFTFTTTTTQDNWVFESELILSFVLLPMSTIDIGFWGFLKTYAFVEFYSRKENS